MPNLPRLMGETYLRRLSDIEFSSGAGGTMREVGGTLAP